MILKLVKESKPIKMQKIIVYIIITVQIKTNKIMYSNTIIFAMLNAYNNRNINKYSIYFICNEMIKGIHITKLKI